MKHEMYEFETNAGIQLARYINSDEVQCKSNKQQTHIISKELIRRVNGIREQAGNPIHCNSGYRDAEYNRTMKPRGSKNSKHVLGLAMDIWMDFVDPLLLAAKAARWGLRVGFYKKFVHVDMCLGEKDDFIGKY